LDEVIPGERPAGGIHEAMLDPLPHLGHAPEPFDPEARDQKMCQTT